MPLPFLDDKILTVTEISERQISKVQNCKNIGCIFSPVNGKALIMPFDDNVRIDVKLLQKNRREFARLSRMSLGISAFIVMRRTVENNLFVLNDWRDPEVGKVFKDRLRHSVVTDDVYPYAKTRNLLNKFHKFSWNSPEYRYFIDCLFDDSKKV